MSKGVVFRGRTVGVGPERPALPGDDDEEGLRRRVLAARHLALLEVYVHEGVGHGRELGRRQLQLGEDRRVVEQLLVQRA